MQSPLSHDEHAAMARYLSGIEKQLHDVADLFKTRYGKGSEITEEAMKTLASLERLEHVFLREEHGKVLAGADEFISRPN